MINKISCCTCSPNQCARQNSNKGQTSFGSITEFAQRTSKIDLPVSAARKISDRFEELRYLTDLANSKEAKTAQINLGSDKSYPSILLTDSRGQSTLVTKNYKDDTDDMGTRLAKAFNLLVQKYSA